MKLYVWRPEGFGQDTFFVVEESREQAKDRIQKEIVDNPNYSEPWDWSRYESEEYEVGEITSNVNS